MLAADVVDVAVEDVAEDVDADEVAVEAVDVTEVDVDADAVVVVTDAVCSLPLVIPSGGKSLTVE